MSAFARHDDAWHVDEAQPLQVEAGLQLAHAERLFRGPAALSRFSRPQREQGLRFLPGWYQPDFFSGQLWNHAVPSGARVSCAAAMEVLYRDLFANDGHGDAAYMWFDKLEDSAPDHVGCPQCEAVRRTIIGVLDALLAMPQEHCQIAALHGLNHWGNDLERARIVDGWLRGASPARLDATIPGEKITVRNFALKCKAGRAP